MSDPFVGPVPMRWEFDTLLNNLTVATTEYTDAYEIARAEVCRAFDAQAARIAELEKENTAMAERLIAGSEPIFASNAQLRARIARGFVRDIEGSVDRPQDEAPTIRSVYDVLARWEAAAKEGE